MTPAAPTVEHFMTRLPHTIASSATLEQAHSLMRKFQIRHLPVLDDDRIVGILSLRDLHLLESLRDVDPSEVPVADAMTHEPYVVDGDTPLNDIAAKMAARKIGSVVVTSRGEVAGIFTTTDALIALLHLYKSAP